MQYQELSSKPAAPSIKLGQLTSLISARAAVSFADKKPEQVKEIAAHLYELASDLETHAIALKAAAETQLARQEIDTKKEQEDPVDV